MTETCGPACLIGPDDARHKIGSTGKSFFHTQVRIADTAGNELPRGEAGEVQVRAPQHEGVLAAAGGNRRDYCRRLVAHRGRGGDGCRGFVTIQDRIKDMIISGGENVYPAEVENVLLSHPGIADAAVIGQDSAKWGESLAVIVRKDESLTEAQVLEHCNGKLARFKQPRAAVFIEQIPRNPSGKVLKRILRQQYPGPARE